MIIARPINAKEPDLLKGREHDTLIVKDLTGQVLSEFTPDSDGWTHDKLEAIDFELVSAAYDGWDAYLCECWIGSSEV